MRVNQTINDPDSPLSACQGSMSTQRRNDAKDAKLLVWISGTDQVEATTARHTPS